MTTAKFIRPATIALCALGFSVTLMQVNTADARGGNRNNRPEIIGLIDGKVVVTRVANTRGRDVADKAARDAAKRAAKAARDLGRARIKAAVAARKAAGQRP